MFRSPLPAIGNLWLRAVNVSDMGPLWESAPRPRGMAMAGGCSQVSLELLPVRPLQHPTRVCPQVTHSPENVLDLQNFRLADVIPEELAAFSRNMLLLLKRLLRERDQCQEVCLLMAKWPVGTG